MAGARPCLPVLAHISAVSVKREGERERESSGSERAAEARAGCASARESREVAAASPPTYTIRPPIGPIARSSPLDDAHPSVRLYRYSASI